MAAGQFNWATLTPSAPINLDGHTGSTTIDGVKIYSTDMGTNDGYGIQISGTGTIRIKNSYIGPGVREGIDIQNFTGDSVVIENCLIMGVKGGIYALNSNNIFVRNCEFVDMWGSKDCRGQFMQFNNVSGDYCGMINSRGINFKGESYQEDMINIYQSNRSSGNPINIKDNIFRGMGPSKSGGGLMTGDNGGAWQTVDNNKLYKPGNYAFAISNGTNIILQNNKSYQPIEDWSNIGMYAYKVAVGFDCNTLTVTNNDIYIRDTEFGNNYWYAGDETQSCGTITGVAGNDFLETNFDDMSEGELDFPVIGSLITYLHEDTLWQEREKGAAYWDEGGACEDANKPDQLHRPTSTAPGDVSISSSSTTLIGGSTSSNGASYRWVQVFGPASATIVSPTSSTTDVTGITTNGDYKFRLEVYDDDSASDGDWVYVTKFSEGGEPPVTDAGIDQSITLPVSSVNVSGSGSTDDGTIVSYAWSKISGPATYTITSPAEMNTSITGLIAGVYVFRLTCTDDEALTDTDDIQITVNAAGVTPRWGPFKAF